MSAKSVELKDKSPAALQYHVRVQSVTHSSWTQSTHSKLEKVSSIDIIEDQEDHTKHLHRIDTGEDDHPLEGIDHGNVSILHKNTQVNNKFNIYKIRAFVHIYSLILRVMKELRVIFVAFIRFIRIRK